MSNPSILPKLYAPAITTGNQCLNSSQNILTCLHNPTPGDQTTCLIHQGPSVQCFACSKWSLMDSWKYLHNNLYNILLLSSLRSLSPSLPYSSIMWHYSILPDESTSSLSFLSIRILFLCYPAFSLSSTFFVNQNKDITYAGKLVVRITQLIIVIFLPSDK